MKSMLYLGAVLACVALSPVMASAATQPGPASTGASYQVVDYLSDGQSVYQNLYGNGSTPLQVSFGSKLIPGSAFSDAYVHNDAGVQTFSQVISTAATRVLSSAGISYEIGVMGPSTSVIVPIDFTAYLSASFQATGNDAASASASLTINSAIDRKDYDASVCAYGCIPTTGTMSIDSSINVYGGQTLSVIEGTLAEASHGTSAFASSDPYFFIDPTFLADNPGYSLTVSAFISNAPVSPLPEPDVWVMMIAGLGLTGAASRRRRSHNGFFDLLGGRAPLLRTSSRAG